jgi:hypothetical protein
MTVETQAREVLLRAADQIDVAPPPIDAVLGAGARRRRRIAAVVAGVGAAAVVVAVAIVNTGGDGSSATPATSSPPLTTAPGTRLVGLNGVMVSVPANWDTDRVRCGIPTADTVFFDTGEYRTCLITPTPRVSVLRISDVGENGAAFQVAQEAKQPVSVDGVDAFRRPTYHYAPSCPAGMRGGGPGSCGSSYDGTLYIPSLGVVLTVSSLDRGEVDAILDSAHLIPDGYVAIPVNATGNELEAIGLQVDLADDLGPDQVAPTNPQEGAIVALGSTVRLAPVLHDKVPDPRLPIATIVKAHGACGPTGGFAVDVTITAERRLNVLVLLLIRGDIVGKAPTKIGPDRAKHVLVQQLQPRASKEVVVEVVGLGFSMEKSLLARLPHIPRTLPPGTACY